MKRLAMPILFKEFAVQMRGSRVALLLAIYVGLSSITARLLYGVLVSQLDRGAPLLSAQIGQVLFIGLSLGLQLLTIFLAPALTLHAISSEYERGTALILQTTPITPLQLVTGKLVAALSLLLLLLLAVAPVFSVVFLFGGVTIADLGRMGGLLLLTAFTGCMLGLCCSAATRQTYSATLLCYALLVCLVGGTLLAANIWSLLNAMRAAPAYYVVANPLSAMAAALVPARPPTDAFVGGLRPLVLLSLLTRGALETGALGGTLPLHRATAVLYGAISLVLFWFTLHLAAPRRRWRLTKVDAALCMVLLGYLVLVYGAREWWLVGLGIGGA
ncbi:ABC transporter permease [Candidatus Viridilinea mediisalina]|uniref:ABC transporter permease n=1 Tax=Candidatus Viridilinea mediisalina TaxID=2024553 RepID=A0A2A6RM20_9CHLR|nr:ABC transporter permease subunit [Candidatus Viridilinea mediisalina]PDW03900.1 hypothetical protein CJ255_06515 [Candidatus Viridilinea mediisalina]